MPARPLTDPIFDADVRRVNFFNGRLLSGEDLSHEQDANTNAERRLGCALGDGVARGLEVSITAGADRLNTPTISVTDGLAVTPRGDTLCLANPVDLALHDLPSTDSSTAGIATFSVCEPTSGNVYVAGAGLYVLTIGAIEGREGRAPVSGLGNIDLSCNTRYLVDGVRFRVIPIQFSNADLNTPNTFRNRMAYRCYSPESAILDDGFWTNPFGPSTGSGLIDALRPNVLRPCEVPLALLYLTAEDGLVFADMWAARRPITAPANETAWPKLRSERRQVERSAMFRQFRDHLQDLRYEKKAACATLRASDYFRYLPAFGLVPLASTTWTNGFTLNAFFHGLTAAAPVIVEAARMTALLDLSYAFPPVDVNSGVALRLYYVRENQLSSDEKAAAPSQRYVAFASAHMPDLGDPHLNVNRWKYANFA